MDVPIYYTGENDGAPGGVERLSTPLESGYDRWRVGFHQSATEPDTWCLMLERWYQPKGKDLGWYHNPDYLLLRKKCGSMADYLEWLTANVQTIEVDGRPLWVNPELGEEE